MVSNTDTSLLKVRKCENLAGSKHNNANKNLVNYYNYKGIKP